MVFLREKYIKKSVILSICDHFYATRILTFINKLVTVESSILFWDLALKLHFPTIFEAQVELEASKTRILVLEHFSEHLVTRNLS